MEGRRFVILLISIELLQSCCGFQDLYVGSPCTNKDHPGICTPYSKCQSAVEAVRSKYYHDYFRCDFSMDTEIICCPLSEIPNRNKKMKRISQEKCKKYSKDLKIYLSYHIIDGDDAKPGEFPHMAAIGYYKKTQDLYIFGCGGTLISHNYVLTAAHCVLVEDEPKIVRLGVLDLPEAIKEPEWKYDYEIAGATIHEKYHRKKANDIALVKLKKTVKFTANIRPACLYTKDDDPEVLIVTGWGQTKTAIRSSRLQKTTLNPVPLQECNSIYGSTNLLTSQICAAYDERDACSGDSGGPLQIQSNTNIYSVVGITSTGRGCATKYPGVYTRVSSYLDWIEKIVWP